MKVWNTSLEFLFLQPATMDLLIMAGLLWQDNREFKAKCFRIILISFTLFLRDQKLPRAICFFNSPLVSLIKVS